MFCDFFTHWYLKLRSVSNTFLDKNPKKQPFWDRTGVIKGRKFFYVIDAFPMTIVIFQ